MEHIDLSTLSDRQLQMHADRAQNDHWQYAKQDNRPGMVRALVEYYRVRVEQSGRHIAQLRTDGASLSDLGVSQHIESQHVKDLNYWSGVAAGLQAVAV